MVERVVFMGSPDFALPTLRALAQKYPVAGVVTQPDQPAGRGRRLTPPPVKILADELGLPMIQPRRLRKPEAMDQLQAWNPDLIVVAAFGQILKPAVLDMPKWGCINVHASILPRWRGAAPIQAAILAGDAETGITIMQMDPGVDTGPVLSQRALSILADDTAESLNSRLADLGADMLIETLPAYLSGDLPPTSQDEMLSLPDAQQPTYASILKKEDGQLDFLQPAEALARRVRAMYPWPGAFFDWQGQPFKVLAAHPASGKAQPGDPLVHAGLPAVGTAEGILILDQVQPAGKKPMPGKVFLQGARNWAV